MVEIKTGRDVVILVEVEVVVVRRMDVIVVLEDKKIEVRTCVMSSNDS